MSCPPSTSGLLCDDSLCHRALQWFFSPTLTLLHQRYQKVNRGCKVWFEGGQGGGHDLPQVKIWYTQSILEVSAVSGASIKLPVLPECLVIKGMVIVELVLDADGNRGQEHSVCVFQRSENSLTKLMFPGATAKKQQSFKGGISNGDGWLFCLLLSVTARISSCAFGCLHDSLDPTGEAVSAA